MSGSITAPADIGIETGVWRGAAHSYPAISANASSTSWPRRSLEPLRLPHVPAPGNPRLAECLATAASIGGWCTAARRGAAWGSPVTAVRLAHRLPVEIEITREQSCACCARSPPSIAGWSQSGDRQAQRSRAASSRRLGRDRPPDRASNGIPLARSIGAYGLPILRDAPEVTVELLESEDERAESPSLACRRRTRVANAFFSLTVQRVRTPSHRYRARR